MSAKSTWLIAVGLVALVAPTLRSTAALAQVGAGNSFLITHVRVFDGDRTHEATDVAVERGVVRAVGRDLTTWRHLPVIDGTGATLLPGLIDAHAHVRSIDDLQEALRFGVTTVLDMGASGVTPRDLSTLRNAAASRMDVADLRFAGFGAPAPGGHGTERRSDTAGEAPTVPTVESADAFVAARRGEGSDYLKVFLNGVRTADRGAGNLDTPRVKALVDAAHSRRMLAVAHVETIEDVEIALAGGIDGLAHVWRRGGANADLAGRLAAKGVFVIPALAIPDGFLADGRSSLLVDPRLGAFLSVRVRQHLGRSFTPVTDGDRRASLEAHIRATSSLHARRVRLLAGTDAAMASPTVPYAIPSAHGISLHRELELLTTAGLSPIEALRAATMNPATAFGLLDRGRIVVGGKADLVLVRGDPTSDVTAARDILRVWRSGVDFERRPGG